MGHKILNRLSRILLPQQTSYKEQLATQSETFLFSVYTSKTSVSSADSGIASLPCETQQKTKKRWNSTLADKAKQFKRQSHQIQAWFTLSYGEPRDNHSPYLSPSMVEEHFSDEKVEIIVPSDSINSSLSIQSGFQHQPVNFYFSSPVLTPQYTPRASIDVDSLRIREEKELLKLPKSSYNRKSGNRNSIGLGKMVNEILGDAIMIADQESEREFEQRLLSYRS